MNVFRTVMAAGAAALFAGILGAGSARADVIYLGDFNRTGTGLGAVPTLLSIQGKRNDMDRNPTTETGKVGWNGTVDFTTGDTAAHGQNQTRTLGELGVTQARDLRIVLNLNEPGNDSMITLQDLVVTAYGMNGAVVFTGAYTGPDLNLFDRGGIGNSGSAFGLDAAQAAQLQAVYSPNLRIGVESTIINVGGGFETFYGGSAAKVQNTAIPEPGTMTLLGMGALGALGVIRRRRA